MKIQVSEHELLNPGYRRAYTSPKNIGHVASGQSRLAGLKCGQRIKPRKIRVRQQGMTEADLIAALQKNGIGRPATYALNMETLIQRNYAEKVGRYLVITTRGRAVLEFLVGKYPTLFSVQFTAKMEEMLDGIASRKFSYEHVVSRLHQFLK